MSKPQPVKSLSITMQLSTIMMAMFLTFLIISSIVEGQQSPPPNLITSLPGFNETIPFKSYTGYLNTHSQEGSFLFYWFHESQRSPSTDPLVIWIQGGPGCSGFLGQSYENGYFLINPGGTTLRSNPHSWNQQANVLYLEQPVNTGFSYSERPVRLCNDSQSSNDMNFALRDFLLQFPQLIGRETFLAGESYAGIYIPVTATRIIQGNQKGEMPQINLGGLLIGNGACNEDIVISEVPNLWFYHSIISIDQYESLVSTCKGNYVNMTSECTKKWSDAFDMLYDPLYLYNSCPEPFDLGIKRRSIRNLSTTNKNNGKKQPTPPIKVEHDTPCLAPYELNKYFNLPPVQKALGVNLNHLPKNGWSYCGGTCIYIHQESMNVMDYYKFLLKNVRMIVYNGDVDMTTPSIGVMKSLKTLNLTLGSDFKGWNLENGVNGGNALFYSFGKGLTFTTIRGAGHMSPAQKPEATLHMLNRFIANKNL